MLDIGGWEFMLVAFVLIIVVGPKELPKMLRGFTRIMTQVRSMAREFTDGMNDLAREADMDDIKQAMEDVRQGNMADIAAKLEGSGSGTGLGDVVETLNASGQELKAAADEAGATGAALAADARKSAEAEEAKSAGKQTKPAQKKKAPKKASPKQAAPKTVAKKAKATGKAKSAKKSATKGAGT